MRCSICLAELKETPEGLRCDACDTLLEPMVDEDAEALESENRRFSQRTWIAIASGAAVAVILFFVAIFNFSPAGQNGQGEDGQPDLVAKLSGSGGFITSDEFGVVLEALQVRASDSTATLIADKGCQHLASGRVEAIQWVNIAGTSLQRVRPDLPGNWTLDIACAAQDGGAILGTFLQDGIAISRVDTSGNLVWTQLKTASRLDPETATMTLLDETLFVVSQETGSGQVKIASTDPSGDENWALPILASGAIARPKIIRNSFGEILFAWNEGANAVRLITLSASGIVVQDTLLPDRVLPLKAINDDDIARSFVLQGEGRVVAELVSASGVAEWQWQDGEATVPLGVLRDGQDFIILASAGARLSAWKLDALGIVSNRLDVALDAEIVSGEIRRLNTVEAAATLELATGAPVDLVLDLRRLSNGLTIETEDLSSITLAAADVAIEDSAPVIDEPAISDIAAGPELPVTDLAETSTTPEPAPQEAGPVASEPVFETAPSIALPAADDVSVTTDPSDTRSGQDDAVAETGPTGAIPLLELQSDPTRARCTFTCVSLDAAAAEYTLMQSVDVNEGETLADVSLRLNDTHETLCSVSGGEPVPDYARQCGR